MKSVSESHLHVRQRASMYRYIYKLVAILFLLIATLIMFLPRILPKSYSQLPFKTLLTSTTTSFRTTSFIRHISTAEKLPMSSQRGPGAATPFLDAVTERRSYYALSKETTIPDSRVEDIVKHALTYTPTSCKSKSCFNR